jgi:alpha-tubulin suppressor-like RCC1 family protein
VGEHHVLALAEDGLVYTCGDNFQGVAMGNNPHVESVLLPTPVEALRGVRVGSVAAARDRSYAAAETGMLWAWGSDNDCAYLLGHGEWMHCPLPKPIASLRAQKVDAVAAGHDHKLALVDDGGVYPWGIEAAPAPGAPDVDSAAGCADVVTPRRIPALRDGVWVEKKKIFCRFATLRHGDTSVPDGLSR